MGALVLGGCLVDIKVYADPAPVLPSILDQLLGYVLSNTEDTFGIRSVGVYLGWRACLSADLHEIMACEPQDLPHALAALRADFQAAVVPDVERARLYKPRSNQDRGSRMEQTGCTERQSTASNGTEQRSTAPAPTCGSTFS